MTKLTDAQAILLSGAAQRSDGQLLPAPLTLKCGADAVTKAIAALIKNGLVHELPVTAPGLAWRMYGDDRFGATINDAGRIAIGVEAAGVDTLPDEAGDLPAPVPNTGSARPTKVTLVLALLQREQGATLAELVEATGWLPHTARAALTGIRKKGHSVNRGKRDDVTCYTLAA